MANVGGMMWQWDPKTGLEQAARQAIAHYERTRGRRPAVCYTNSAVLASAPAAPLDGEGSALVIAGVRLCSLQGIAPSHLWLVEEESDPGRAGSAG
jgi:hypothetical protein